jgi:protein SCO1/2
VSRLAGRVLLLLLVTASAPAQALAQMTGAPNTGYKRDSGIPAAALPAPLREIGFEQNLDQRLPLDAEWLDEQGQQVRLGQYFGAKPVILAFVYYDCPLLCTVVVDVDDRHDIAQRRPRLRGRGHQFRFP